VLRAVATTAESSTDAVDEEDDGAGEGRDGASP
jgi:hypothetical protein